MTGPLTGRLSAAPSGLLDEEILGPQFRYELEHLLPWYVAIEKVLAAEYARLGVVSEAEATALGTALDGVNARTITADTAGNMSDIAFAVERFVEQRLPRPIPAWHVDRSRNDLQSCAQLLFGREELVRLAARLREFGTAVRDLAEATRDMPMPGYTHFQAAQVITPGFYLAAVSEQVLHTTRRLLSTYDGIDACPLGSGAMAGQELAWDRDRMARLLGFQRVQPVALTGVASRGWVAEVTAELGLLGVALSRFATDLLTWGSSEYGFIDLPDELSGISSAMPQKKNYPILERIRGRTAHLTSWYVDVATAQRNTPYSNTVEVSKESSAQLGSALATLRSLLRLFTEVLGKAVFRTEHGRIRCDEEYLGGFSLANRLTLDQHVPWRDAQVIAGRYVVAALEAGLGAGSADGSMLAAIAAAHGYAITSTDQLLRAAFDPQAELRRRRSRGSAHPGEVSRLLAAQEGEHTQLKNEIAARRSALDAMPARIDRVLTSVPAMMPGTRPGELP
jgi:argininosuccinate lyase